MPLDFCVNKHPPLRYRSQTTKTVTTSISTLGVSLIHTSGNEIRIKYLTIMTVINQLHGYGGISCRYSSRVYKMVRDTV